MEEDYIIYVDHYHNGDFDELNLRIRPIVSVEYVTPVDDEHDFFLKVTTDGNHVVGATILEADHWLDEIAAAFARRDLDHPDVRFFFEQKIKVLGECWRAEQQSAAANAATESATPAEV